MLEFKKVGKEELNKLISYFEADESMICDYSFGVSDFWSEFYEYEYALSGGLLFATAKNFEGRQSFCFPIGGGDKQKGLDEIAFTCAYYEKPLYFALLDAAMTSAVIKHFQDSCIVKCEYNRKWYDYLYEAAALRDFSGKRYHGQKNRVNKFEKSYETAFIPLEEVDFDIYSAFLKEYYAYNPASDDVTEYEKKKLFSFAEQRSYPLGMNRALFASGKMVGFCMGEVKGKTGFVHIEKALGDYAGSYQVIVSRYAKDLIDAGAAYINREEDMNDAGLKTSKLSYHPLTLLEKSTICVNSCNYIDLNLRLENIAIRPLKKEDEREYARLSKDEERNKYWGYDYKKDTGGKVPLDDYFLNTALCDRRSNTEYSYAITNLKGEFAGEIVLHNFIGKSAELGIRLLEECEGRNIAFEAFKGLSDYLLLEGYFDLIRAKCYKENIRSQNMILRSGFKKREILKDGEFLYFIKQRTEAEEKR